MKSPLRAAVAASALAIAAVYAGALARGALALRDLLLYSGPVHAYLGEALRAGRIPEWCDRIGFGVPFASNPVNGVAYPGWWIVALLAPPLGLEVVALLHLAVLGAGTGLLAARLGGGRAGAALAAAAVVASGYVTSMVPNGMAPIVAWLPWVALAADRLGEAVARGADGRERARAAVGLAVALALQLTAGEPASLVDAGLVAGAILLFRGRRPLAAAAHGAAAAVLATALAGAAVLPAISAIAGSGRAETAARWAGVWALRPARLVEAVWPGALGDPLDPAQDLGRLVADAARGLALDRSWSFGLFLGAPLLLLALRGAADRAARRLLAIAAAVALLAFGPATPAHALVRVLVPLERAARYPEKHVLPLVVLACALAGVGMARLAAEGAGRRLRVAAWAAAAALLAATVVAALAPAALVERLAVLPAARPPAVDVPAALEHAARGGLLAAGAALAFAAACELSARGRGRAALALAAAAVLAPLAVSARGLVVTAPRELAEAPSPLLEPVLAAAEPGGLAPRMFQGSGQGELRPRTGEWVSGMLLGAAVNAAVPWGVDEVPGYDAAEGSELPRVVQLASRMPLPAFADLASIPWFLLDESSAARARLPLVAAGGGWALLGYAPGRPRAFVAPRWSSAGEEAAEAEVASRRAGFDAGRVVITGDAGSGEGAGPLSPCAVEAPTPERVTLSCSSPAGGIAVLLDAPAAGWTASVDGAPAELLRADALFRGVRVGPGTHVVRLEYRAPGLRAGALLALAAWLAAGGVLWRARRRGGTARPGAPHPDPLPAGRGEGGGGSTARSASSAARRSAAGETGAPVAWRIQRSGETLP